MNCLFRIAVALGASAVCVLPIAAQTSHLSSTRSAPKPSNNSMLPYQVKKGSLNDFTDKSDSIVGYFATEAAAQKYAQTMNESLGPNERYRWLYMAGENPKAAPTD